MYSYSRICVYSTVTTCRTVAMSVCLPLRCNPYLHDAMGSGNMRVEHECGTAVRPNIPAMGRDSPESSKTSRYVQTHEVALLRDGNESVTQRSRMESNPGVVPRVIYYIHTQSLCSCSELYLLCTPLCPDLSRSPYAVALIRGSQPLHGYHTRVSHCLKPQIVNKTIWA